MSGFHSNTNCLTAALQGLFSAAGSSLTPVCQGGVMEGEYDLAHLGIQHNFLFFFAKKFWKPKPELHPTFWEAVKGTFEHHYSGYHVNHECYL